jgi:hypothetical protein
VPFLLPKNMTQEEAEADLERTHALARQQSEWQGLESSAGVGGVSVAMCATLV